MNRERVNVMSSRIKHVSTLLIAYADSDLINEKLHHNFAIEISDRLDRISNEMLLLNDLLNKKQIVEAQDLNIKTELAEDKLSRKNERIANANIDANEFMGIPGTTDFY